MLCYVLTYINSTEFCICYDDDDYDDNREFVFYLSDILTQPFQW